MRVGGEREIKVDVRIIAATNKNLDTLVREGLFRKDLYYRLKVMVIDMPPLRERVEDVMLLANLFIEENNKEHNKNIKSFSEEAKDLMTQYHWPGNVRELKNVIERAMILTDQEVISQKHLPFELRQVVGYERPNAVVEQLETTDEMSLEYAEKMHLSKILKRLEWNKSKASKALGISRATLRAKIKKYRLPEN
jgi:transcriptional regulator with PAS, ATPase and Fis domain